MIPQASCSPLVFLTVALRVSPSGRGPATLRGVDEALAELAAYFRRWCEPPDAELVRLAAAARAAGSRWEAIAAACDERDDPDAAAVVYRPFGLIPGQGAGPLFRVTQHAVHDLTGSDCGYYSPLTWPCPGCGRQVTDRAYGRPVHVEHGHGPGCARLARDQAADDAARRDRLPRQVVHSEDAAGPVQRHWLAERITDDCPRCGWHGYFHHYLATVDGDWAAAVCDDCYADLHPGITVTVKFFSRARFGRDEPFAVIRQRDPQRPRLPQHRALPRYRAADDLAAVLGAHLDAGRGGAWRRRCRYRRDQPRRGRADHGRASRP